MLQVSKILAAGHGLAPTLLNRAATVELDWDVRQKSRFDCTDSRGRHLGVFLPRGTVARGGDVLVAEDGSLVSVIAAPQPVLVITPCAEHGGAPFDLTRAAYHLGNRHVPIELQARPPEDRTRPRAGRHAARHAPDGDRGARSLRARGRRLFLARRPLARARSRA